VIAVSASTSSHRSQGWPRQHAGEPQRKNPGGQRDSPHRFKSCNASQINWSTGPAKIARPIGGRRSAVCDFLRVHMQPKMGTASSCRSMRPSAASGLSNSENQRQQAGKARVRHPACCNLEAEHRPEISRSIRPLVHRGRAAGRHWSTADRLRHGPGHGMSARMMSMPADEPGLAKLEDRRVPCRMRQQKDRTRTLSWVAARQLIPSF